ncbi:MAG: thiol-disulfide oxidoreductase DCC family protein [Bacteroidales bacterium]|nr:thiol-disulfide oxidoreductase DCC family protein [Bacteroidales bacterium]
MNPDRLIIFDGVCNLCNGTVRFIISRDRKKRFKFLPLQSEAGHEMLSTLSLTQLNQSTVAYIKDGILYQKSAAVLNILRDLGGCWKLFYGLVVVPSFIRDGIYDIVARKRNRWFGRRDSCMIPSPDIRERFL